MLQHNVDSSILFSGSVMFSSLAYTVYSNCSSFTYLVDFIFDLPQLNQLNTNALTLASAVKEKIAVGYSKHQNEIVWFARWASWMPLISPSHTVGRLPILSGCCSQGADILAAPAPTLHARGNLWNGESAKSRELLCQVNLLPPYNNDILAAKTEHNTAPHAHNALKSFIYGLYRLNRLNSSFLRLVSNQLQKVKITVGYLNDQNVND